MSLSPRPKRNKACAGRELLMKNQISELPDDILIHVISFLTFKEAGRTSVLSKRWRHMWAYIPTLDFDSRKFFDDGFELGTTKSLEGEGPRYLNWVDQVVSSHKASSIDKFRVFFDTSSLGNSGNSIDNWFRFAMEKRVKKLAIDLSRYYYKRCRSLRHTFSSLPLCNSLTSLKLGCVNITESFLCNCRALEYLLVKHSKSLVRLKVSGPSLTLKRLKIYNCTRLKQLVISAPNLVSVCYFGPKINVQFESAQKLVQVSFGISYADDLINICSDLSSCLSQIEAFSLESVRPIMYRRISVEGSVFTRLKMLDVLACPNWNDDFYCFISLIQACPLLHHFKLRLIMTALDYNKRRELRKWEACPHYHLKIVGFVGHAIDLEFAAYLIESAFSLDKIIADTRVLPRLGTPSPREFEVTEERKRAMEKAEQLRAKRNCGTKLEII